MHRESSRAVALWLLLSLFLLPIASAQGQEIVELQSVELGETATGSELRLAVSATPRFAVRNHEDGGFSLRLLTTALAPTFAHLNLENNLVTGVLVEPDPSSDEPAILITVLPRQRLKVSVRSGEGLLRAAIEPTAAPAPLDPTPTAPTTPTAQPRGEGSSDDRQAIEDLRFELERVRAERDALANANALHRVSGRADPCLNIRDRPAGDVIDCVLTGTEARLIDSSGEWALMKFPHGTEGWGKSEYFDTASPSSRGSDLSADLDSTESALRLTQEENAELREELASSHENLERAWEAQQNLSARLIEVQSATNPEGAAADAERLLGERDRLAERVRELEADRDRQRGELEGLTALKAESEDNDSRALQELEAELSRAREALALGSSTYVVGEVNPCLNLRAQPDSEDRVDCLEPRTRGVVVELRSDWGKLRLPDGREGWASMRFLEPAPALPEELAELESTRLELSRLRTAEAQRLESDDQIATLENQARELRLRLEVSRDAAAAELAPLRDEASTLRARVTELESERNDFQAQAEAVRSNALTSEESLSQARDRAATAEQELLDLRSRLQTADERVRELETRATATQTVEEAEARAASLEQDLESWKARAEASENLTRELEDRIATIGSAEDQAADLEEEIQGWKTRNEALESQLAESRELAEVAEARLVEVESVASRSAETEALAAGLREESATWRARAEAAEERVSSLESQADDSAEFADRVVQLETDLTSWRERAESAERELSEVSRRNRELTSDLSASDRELARVAELETHVETLERELAESKDAVRAQAETASSWEERFQTAAAELDVARQSLAEASELTGQLEEAREGLTEIDELSNQLAELRVANAEAQADAETATERASEIERERSNLVTRLKASEARALRVDEADATAQKELAAVREELERSAEQAAAATAKVVGLESDRETSRAASETLQSSIDELRTSLAETSANLENEQERNQALQADLKTRTSSEATRSAEFDDRETELETSLDSAVSELRSLETRLAAAQAERAASTARLRDLRDTLTTAETTFVVNQRANPCLKLREVARTGPSVDCLVPGSRFAVLELEDEWARVRLATDVAGWVAREFIEPAPALPSEVMALEESQAELAEARAAARASAKQNERAEALASKVRERSAELETTLASESEAKRALESQNAELRASVERLETSEEARAAEAGDTSEQLEAASGRVRTLEAELAAAQASADQNQQAEAVAVEAQERSSELEASLVSETEARRALESQNAELRASLERLEASEAARLAEAGDATEKLESDAERIRALEAELSETRRRADAAETATSELTAAQRKAEELSRSLEAAQAELETTQATAASLRREVVDSAATESRIAEFEADLKASKSARQALEESVASLEARLSDRSDTESALAALRRELADARTALQETATANVELTGKVEALTEVQVELAEAQERVKVLEGEAARRSAERASRAVEPAVKTTPEPSPAPNSVAETPEPVDHAKALQTFVESWARAWSDQRVDDYLELYSTAFEPSDGTDRAIWEEQRRARLAAPTFIEIELREIEVRTLVDGNVEVSFEQSYRSNTFSDVVRKALTLARISDGWKITSERTAP